MKKVLFPILALVLALGLSLPMAMPAVANPDPGLVGLWHLDEGSGQTAADATGVNDGQLGSTPGVDANDPTWEIPGKFGNALSFDGVNDYVDCGAGIAITTAITVEAWIKPSAFTNYDAIVANFVWPTNPEGFSFRVMANGKLVWRAVLSGNNAYSITSNAALETGNWYHVAVTHDSSYTRLYINGTLDKEETPGGTIINLGKALKIGWDDYAADRVFNGTIDEVRIWDEALDAKAIGVSYDGGLKKTLTQYEAELGDIVGVNLRVIVGHPDVGDPPPVDIADTLPSELRYIPGTFEVNGVSDTPVLDGNQVSYTLTQLGFYLIHFDAQVTSAEADDNTVTNTAIANGASASAELTIYPYEGFTKEIEWGQKKHGEEWYDLPDPTVVPIGTDIKWLVVIGISNVLNDNITTMRRVVVQDRLGGDLEVLRCVPSTSVGPVKQKLSGKTEKVHLTWPVTRSLADGASESLSLVISTDINPGTGNGKKPGHQEYTSPGWHELNSGAVVKFIDDESEGGTGFQLSAHTPALAVYVPDAMLELEDKYTSNWSIIEDGTYGELHYNTSGDEFYFVFQGYGLELEEDYSLIYYADTEDRYVDWGGDNPGALIGTGMTDGAGNLVLSGSIDLGWDLPHPDDANGYYYDYTQAPDYYDNGTGAKIWLVPSDCYDAGAKKVDTWSPTRFLFETDLIEYDDTDD